MFLVRSIRFNYPPTLLQKLRPWRGSTTGILGNWKSQSMKEHVKSSRGMGWTRKENTNQEGSATGAGKVKPYCPGDDQGKKSSEGKAQLRVSFTMRHITNQPTVWVLRGQGDPCGNPARQTTVPVDRSVPPVIPSNLRYQIQLLGQLLSSTQILAIWVWRTQDY